MKHYWTLLLIATLCGAVGCATKAGSQPTVGARKAALAAQCVGQGGAPKVDTDGVTCEVASGIRWKVLVQ